MTRKQREAATSTWLLNAMPRALQGGSLPWGAEDGNNTQKTFPRPQPCTDSKRPGGSAVEGLLPLFSRLKARPHPHGPPPQQQQPLVAGSVFLQTFALHPSHPCIPQVTWVTFLNFPSRPTINIS